MATGMTFSISPRPPGAVVVILKDGRQIDISKLSASAALEKLLAAGVTRTNIAATIHYCDVRGLPRTQPPSGLRGDPGAPRTVNDDTRGSSSSSAED